MSSAVAGRAATRTEQVYTQLRGDILAGRLLPGARLPFAELAERYGGSMSAIREGLQRLVEQGIVVSEPQLGFRVVTLSADDLHDLTVARCEIEGLALRYAIANGDLAWESEIVAAAYALERTPVDGDDREQAMSQQWTDAHRRFHRALIAGCPNQRLRSVASSLRDAAELYRHWSKHAESPARDVDAEHGAIVEAVLARNAELATHLLEQHLRTTAGLVLDRVSGHGEAAAALLSE
jgi:DNA-binding GntR family transcriptional regulator